MLVVGLVILLNLRSVFCPYNTLPGLSLSLSWSRGSTENIGADGQRQEAQVCQSSGRADGSIGYYGYVSPP